MLEILRSLATSEEVEYLMDRAFGDAGPDPDAFPRARESMTFLAGMAVRCRNAGAPFEATWSLVSERKGLDALADPQGRAFWDRVRFAMRALASPDWGGAVKKNRDIMGSHRRHLDSNSN
ncbi:hypothetical protein [Paludisphaera soli]|uniref:hypothetical protein n=1 Tax=Paludisphaera soli TaxID=2712865 RepID=UPI0013ED4D5A|nr:hypothetical protein [Paludisphaera soli]